MARLAEGAVGRAQHLISRRTAARNHALAIVTSALRGSDHSELFKVTESYRPGADGRAKLEQLIRTIYSILQDMMFLQSNTPELARNSDITAELKRLNESADFEWIAAATDRLAEVERGMRRNLLRSLSLDSFAVALEKGA